MKNVWDLYAPIYERAERAVRADRKPYEFMCAAASEKEA